VTPAILHVEPSPLGGPSVRARFACGHAQTSWFPHAPRRGSRQRRSVVMALPGLSYPKEGAHS
jgi:hypothetical protein